MGRVTTGGYGHRVEKSLALGFVRADLAAPGTELKVEILDELRPAKVIQAPCYDPENLRLKA